MADSVLEVANANVFKEKLASAGAKLVVAWFYTNWCAPCRSMRAKYHQFGSQYSNVVFLKIDVDECGDLARENEVRSVPHFIFFKHSTRLAAFTGASEEKLEEEIKRNN